MVPGRGDRTSMSLRSKVFEFSLGLAPTVTIGHVWSTISNLAASISDPSGRWCHLEAHGVGTKLTHLRIHRLIARRKILLSAPPVLLDDPGSPEQDSHWGVDFACVADCHLSSSDEPARVHLQPRRHRDPRGASKRPGPASP